MSTWASLTSKTKQYTITTQLLPDQDYTISFGRVGTDSIDVLIGNELVGSITDSPLTFRVAVPSDSLTIRTYYDTTIDWIKLEKGKKATEWVPAIAEITAEVNDPSNYSWKLQWGDLSVYQPSIYDGVLEYEEVIRAEGEVLSWAHKALNIIQDSRLLRTIPIEYIESYEKIFNIIPNASIESIEFRRQRVINRLSMKPPFTYEFLVERLDDIVGKGQYSLEYDKDNFTLFVESSAENQQWASELSITINSIKPANIVYVQVPAIFSSLLMNSQTSYSQSYANYIAGQWIVGQKDIISYQERGLLNMALQKTMREAMIEDTLAQVGENVIADFYLNNSVALPSNSTVDKETNRLITTCEVTTESGVTNITSVALRNASGQILEQFSTSVPVVEGVTLKHYLSLEEGVK